jgi:hypothetical protein
LKKKTKEISIENNKKKGLVLDWHYKYNPNQIKSIEKSIDETINKE